VPKVVAGYFSLTELTDPAAHRAYNEWHQLDHLPEQYPLAGVVSGQRWVATPACRAARAASEPALDPVQYLTLYLLADPLAATLADFLTVARELRRAGRFFDARRALLSGPFGRAEAEAAPRVLVSAEAVPHRPCTGIYAIVEGEGSGASDLATLCTVQGVAGAWTFAAGGFAADHRFTTGHHQVTLCWLDDDPVTVAARLAPVLEADWARRSSRPSLAGPFETITPWSWDWFSPENPA
jgi:hypothetical protein